MLKTVLNDEQLTSKIEIAGQGLKGWFVRRLEKHGNKNNAFEIAKFVIATRTESNIVNKSSENFIFLLSRISDFVRKDFKDFTRDDVISFLDTYRKPEADDPEHSWIGSYNLHRTCIMRFFRWLYYPEDDSRERPRPSCLDNIPKLKRKEKSIYKPSDLWSSEDDLLFLKYCPSRRDRCYHMIAKDSAARPHEILKLKISSVVFKMAADRQYAEIVVNGKTGQRKIPLISSLPYVKDWIESHPQSGNPNAVLICGFGKSIGRRISPSALYELYRKYKNEFFPRLLEDPSVPSDEKAKIKELLRKPWNPYLVGRHSGLTEKSKLLNDSTLKSFAGWSMGSNMAVRYTHYFGNEGSNQILSAYGLTPKEGLKDDKLRPKICPNCSESSNKHDAVICRKCKMILTYDEYEKAVEERVRQKDEIAHLREVELKHEMEMKAMNDKLARLDGVLIKIDKLEKELGIT